MKFQYAGLAVISVIAVATTNSGYAQDAAKTAKASLADLPAWKVPDICAKDSARSHCVTLESRAWRTVSGSWVSVPDAVKSACLGGVRSPLDQSWRVLGDCIEVEMSKSADKKAVSTIRTPAEAVPPPKSTATAVPPPILGFAAAPPPFALDAEAEAKRKAEADAAAKAITDAAAQRRAADDEARRKAVEAETAKKAAGDAEAKRRADAEAAKKAADDAEAKRKADAEAAQRRKAEADAAAKRAAADAAAKACQDKLADIAKAGTIRFRTGSASLDEASQTTITQLAAAAKECPGTVVRVEGHTDAIGDAEQNTTLSRNRAQTVVDALVKAGLDATIVSAEGFGQTRPIGDNATSEGRTQNRRIEFVVRPK